MASNLASGDDLVHSVTLHNPRKLILNGYVLPFILAQIVWTSLWIFVYGMQEHYEAGLVGIAVIAVFQIFICLCCQWSVHVHTFLNCGSVSQFFHENSFRQVNFSFRDFAVTWY